jgi:uncharacterized protein
MTAFNISASYYTAKYKIRVMRLLFFTVTIFTITVLANAQSEKVVIGTIDTVNSKILDEKRVIWIYSPNKETGGEESRKRYPVIYLLDGDWHFSSVVGITEQMSFINGNTICPEMIIVGITIPDRYRDLTPSRDSAYSYNSGGSSRFISFIKDELIPYVDSTYQVTPYKLLIGHSLGGLTTVNTMIAYPRLFNSYVAIDPSMWWDNQVSLRETEKALSNNRYDNISLFLAIANGMGKDMDTTTVRKDTTRNTLHIRSALEFSDLLKSNPDNKLNHHAKYYEKENHGSVPHIATYDALHFIFDFYNLPLTKKDYADTSLTLGYRIEDHYKIISEKMGYRINPSESTINTFGYNALYLNNLALAEYLFKLNMANYPDSYNTYDSLGDYYNSIDDYEQAAKMYNKALSIFNNIETRKKLKSVQKK